MMTPQLTEQYGQVLRVSLVRVIFKVLAWATTGVTSKPKADNTVPPAIELCRNMRRDMAIRHLLVLRPRLQGRYPRLLLYGVRTRHWPRGGGRSAPRRKISQP